ncbi:MAG: hypothetical protein ACI83D_000716 [Planctomycetota bacterium]
MERETWEERYNRFTKHFIEYIPDGITPELSLADTNSFTTQVRESDIVFFYGGDPEILRLRLEQYDIPAIFDNKVVAGTSAGSAVFCSEYWGYSTRRPAPGLGIFPIKFMPHCYAELPDPGIHGPLDRERAKEELRQSGDSDQKIYDLREGEYVML